MSAAEGWHGTPRSRWLSPGCGVIVVTPGYPVCWNGCKLTKGAREQKALMSPPELPHAQCATVQQRGGRAMVAKLLASALWITAVLFFGVAAGMAEQQIERGNGVVCDSPQQVERFIALDIDTNDAIARINAESPSGSTCEFTEAEYIVGGIVGDASNSKGIWEIRKVLIVGLIVGRVRKPVLAYEKYTAFVVSKASPL
jgi:hypothetical protein